MGCYGFRISSVIRTRNDVVWCRSQAEILVKMIEFNYWRNTRSTLVYSIIWSECFLCLYWILRWFLCMNFRWCDGNIWGAAITGSRSDWTLYNLRQCLHHKCFAWLVPSLKILIFSFCENIEEMLDLLDSTVDFSFQNLLDNTVNFTI